MRGFRASGAGARCGKAGPARTRFQACRPLHATHCVSRLLTAAVCASLFAGCSTIPKTPARLYNLNNGQVIHAKLFYFKRGYGAATAVLPGGLVLKGTYALTSTGGHFPRPPAAPVDPRAGLEGADSPRVFGYTGGYHTRPVGYGALSTHSGISLRFVLYSVDPAHRYGAGLGRDNRGDWYRVHVGDLDKD